MNRPYADFMHKVGTLGDKILKDERGLGEELVSHNIRRLQNFAWWTYEFGLVKSNPYTNHFRRKENDIDYEIYGSGIISSFDETMNIIKCAKGISNNSKILSYDIEEMIMTCFNYSQIQDRYYVVESMEALYKSFENNQKLFWFEG
jgi:phenylalanine-4-hydroxylase